jgi:hypothetical protein
MLCLLTSAIIADVGQSANEKIKEFKTVWNHRSGSMAIGRKRSSRSPADIDLFYKIERGGRFFSPHPATKEVRSKPL